MNKDLKKAMYLLKQEIKYAKTSDSDSLTGIIARFDELETAVKKCYIPLVSQRSELLKLECKEVPFDGYLKKYFKAPTTELIYRKKYDGKQMTEKEIIRMYKKAFKL